MKRPFGVLFSAFLLALFAGLELLVAAFSAGALHVSTSVLQPDGSTLGGTRFDLISLLQAVGYASLAVWTITTLIGLIRLRPWSRPSTLAVSAVQAALALYYIARKASVFADPALQSTLHTLSPRAILGDFFTPDILFDVAVVSLGICWLIYFNLPITKASFRPFQSIPAPNRRLPNPILLLALTYFTTSAFFLFFLIRHLPGLFFGHPTPGPWVYAGGAIAMTLAGFGLLRLDPRARIATFALLTIGMANAIVSALPHFREPLNLFAIAVLQRLQAPRPLATAYSLTSGSTLPAIVLLSAFTLYFAYALHRYRSAFTRS